MTKDIFEEFDQEGQKLLGGLKFLDFEEVNLGKTGNQDPLATVRSNKSFEKMSNEYAKRSPFGENSMFSSPQGGDFYEKRVNFIDVLYRIGAPMPESGEEEESDGIKLDEVVIEKINDKSIFNYNKYAIEASEAINYWQYRGTDFSGQAILNKKIAYLDSDKIFIDTNGNGFAKYTLYVVYENDSNVSLNNPNFSYLKTNCAIQINFLDIDGLLVILSNLSSTTRKEKLVYLDNIYKTIAREIESNILREPAILSILDSLPPDLLKYFKNETLETIFFGLLTISLVQKNERIILNLLVAFYSKTDFNADSFLNKLLTKTIGDKSALQVLYDNMNDWGGQNNFSTLIIELAKIWILSSYSNPESKMYSKYEPTVPLSYYQNYILGFRNDNFTFEFQKNNNILVSQNIIVNGKNIGEKYNYHPFQPIAVVNLEETENEELKLTENVAIPAFYLKAFDDKGVWENFEKTVWIAVDLISLFSGIGNLAKLRYLIQTEKLAVVVIKTAFGIIQVASPILSIGLSLVENSKNRALVNKIRQYLFWVEICTLGADILSTKILSKKASEASETLAEYRKTVKNQKQLDEIDEFAEHLDEVAQVDNLGKVSGRGRRLGQKLSRSEIDDLVDYLKKQGCDFEIFPINGSHDIKNFIGPNGKPLIFEKGKQAAFVYTSTRMKFVVREGATVYETLHEFIHFKHAKSIGLAKYHSLGGANTAGELIKEQRVFDKIIENKDLLTRKELKWSLDYLNDLIYNPRGIDPIELPFDINKIPEVRKEINIKTIFNLK